MNILAKSLLVTVLSTATLIAGSSPDYETYQINAQAKECKQFQKTVKAAQRGDVAAKYNLGVDLLNGLRSEKDELQALRWLGEAAKAGHSGAQYYLGEFYQYGLGTLDVDKEDALQWYQKAAAQGHQLAQIMVKQLTEAKSNPSLTNTSF